MPASLEVAPTTRPVHRFGYPLPSATPPPPDIPVSDSLKVLTEAAR
ncbi:hypothetical protein [Saccharothrix variisporea]